MKLVSFDRSSLNGESRRFIAAVSVHPPSCERPLKQCPTFYRNVDPNPDPDPESQTYPDPGPDPGRTLIKVKKVDFYMKNILKVPVGKRSKTYRTVRYLRTVLWIRDILVRIWGCVRCWILCLISQ
jgi:hypothetical protein